MCTLLLLVGLGKGTPPSPEGPPDAATSIAPRPLPGTASLAQCQARADYYAQRLSGDSASLLQPPFVLVGDLPRTELDACYHQTIQPAVSALTTDYLQTAPTRPVVLLLFRTTASYREHARRLFGDRELPVYGYYKPARRVAVINCETGRGTVLHELTHVLLSDDFPQAPDWLNEGLASLHESCRVEQVAGRWKLTGTDNWRRKQFLKEVQLERLPPLGQWFAAGDFRGPQQARNYAYARYLCLYLQQQGQLTAVYRALRSGAAATDPHGQLGSAVFGPRAAFLDADLRRWAVTEQ